MIQLIRYLIYQFNQKYYTESPVTVTEKFCKLIRGRQKLHSLSRPFYATKAMIVILSLFFTFVDGIIIFGSMDHLLTQNQYISYIAAGAISLILNFTPLLAAFHLKKHIYRTEKHALVYMVIAIVAFLALYSGTVIVRVATMDMYSQESLISDNLYIDEMENVNSEENTEEDQQAIAMTILLSISPLVTSILNFLFGLIADDVVKNTVDYCEIRKLELREFITDLQAILATIHYDRDQLIKYDDFAYESAVENVLAMKKILKTRARIALVEYLKDKDATSVVLDPKTDDNNDFEEQDISEKIKAV